MSMAERGETVLDMSAAAGAILALGEALRNHDAARAAACYTEDAIYSEVGTGISVSGRQAVEEVTREVLRAFPDATFGLGRTVPGEHSCTVEWWSEGSFGTG
jgi:ketosteroid isomerase-like protein